MLDSALITLADWAQAAGDALWAAVEAFTVHVGVLLLVFVLAGLATTSAPLALLLVLLCLACG